MLLSVLIMQLLCSFVNYTYSQRLYICIITRVFRFLLQLLLYQIEQTNDESISED